MKRCCELSTCCACYGVSRIASVSSCGDGEIHRLVVFSHLNIFINEVDGYVIRITYSKSVVISIDCDLLLSSVLLICNDLVHPIRIDNRLDITCVIYSYDLRIFRCPGNIIA